MKRKKDRQSEDREWVKQSKAGDKEAFSRLVRKYEKRVYFLAYGMLGSREDALDITQEAFLKAFRYLGGFRGGSDFYTWLYRIAYNLVIDLVRKEGRRKNVEYDDTYVPSGEAGINPSPSPHFDPARTLAQRELSRVIMGAIQELPAPQRAVIVLREIEGLSYEEISTALNIRKGTVMSRLHYARQRLQEVLEPYIKEGKVVGS
ncbi:MAG: sigma-70 family RNA polymerase sigma factor [bacterium]|nr:sigma-70 family RNA polymerase sigma factor [bacterium]